MQINSGLDHRCIATGCHRRVGVEFLFCKHHWEKLPIILKDPVLAAPPNGKEQDLAIEEAILYFEKVEGLI